MGKKRVIGGGLRGCRRKVVDYWLCENGVECTLMCCDCVYQYDKRGSIPY